MNQGHQDIGAKAGAPQTSEQQLICLNQNLLESVVSGDWLTYSSHCCEDLTCFEAETNGVLAEGLAFHQFYFDLPAAAPSEPAAPIQVSMGQTTYSLDQCRRCRIELHPSHSEIGRRGSGYS